MTVMGLLVDSVEYRFCTSCSRSSTRGRVVRFRQHGRAGCSAVVEDEFAVVLPVMLACVASMVAMVWWMSRRRDNRLVDPQQARENHQTSVCCLFLSAA